MGFQFTSICRRGLVFSVFACFVNVIWDNSWNFRILTLTVSLLLEIVQYNPLPGLQLRICFRIKDILKHFSFFVFVGRMFLVDGGRRIRRRVSLSVIESEARRRMSQPRTSISDVRISSSNRASLSELGLGKTGTGMSSLARKR